MTEQAEDTPDGVPIVTRGTRESLRDYIRREYGRNRDLDLILRPLIARMNDENPQIDLLRADLIEMLEEQDPHVTQDCVEGYDDGLKHGILLGNELIRRQQEALNLKKGIS